MKNIRTPVFLFLFPLIFFLASAPATYAAGTIFACDDFEEAGGPPAPVTLASHTPTDFSGCSVVGFTWVLGNAGGTTLNIKVTNRSAPASSGRAWYYQSGGTAPDNANYTVQADVTAEATKTIGTVSTRWLDTGNKDKGYFVRRNSSQWQLYRADGGNTQTAICTNFTDSTAPSGTTISLKASGTGATVTLLVQKNGVDIIGGTQSTCTDSSASRIVITGRPGIVDYFSDNIRDNQWLTNWKATNEEVVAPVAPSRSMRLFEGFKIKLLEGKMILHQKQ